MTPQVTLKRLVSDDHGTLGQLLINGKHFCFTTEPPWKDNRPNKSCIVSGEHTAFWHFSPRYKWVYQVEAPGRSFILTHPGNFSGDREKGLKTNTLGCILLGSKIGFLRGQRVILNSRPTVRRFFKLLNKQPFTLKITGDYHA